MPSAIGPVLTRRMAPPRPTARAATRWPTSRRGPSAWMRCCCTHAAAVHAEGRRVSARPATQVSWPRASVTARGMKASVPKKAKVRRPRMATAAGSPGANRSVPGGHEADEGPGGEREAGGERARPPATAVDAVVPRAPARRRRRGPRPAAPGSGRRRRPSGGVGRSSASRRAGRVITPPGRRAGGSPRRRTARRGRARGRWPTAGPIEAGDDPGGREHGEHPGPQRGRVGAADRRVGDGRDGAGADALHHACRDEHGHARRRAGDGEADGEEREPEDERPGGAEPVGALPGHHGADERAEEEAAEHPAVEAEAAEVVAHLRHDRRDGQRLERHQRDGEHQPDREPPPFGEKRTQETPHTRRPGLMVGSVVAGRGPRPAWPPGLSARR